jgi:hypothetical protein
MKYLLFFLSIIFIGCDNVYKDKTHEGKSIATNSLKTKDTLLSSEETEYNKAYVLEKLGSEKFNLLRNDYKQNLYATIDKFGNTSVLNETLGFNEAIVLIEKCGISKEQLKNLIPISPVEFKIYDSFFSNKKQKNKIECFERVIYELACNSNNDFALKEDLIILYTNMYSYIYQGALLNEERVGDGDYYYAINTLICKNSQLFCQKIWSKTNELVKSRNNDLFALHNCRCEKKVLDEFDFCE